MDVLWSPWRYDYIKSGENENTAVSSGCVFCDILQSPASDEEKFILDANEERHERTEIILSSTLNGKSKLLDSVATKHKTKSTVVRFLKEMDQMIGVDLTKYGPFKAEDVATIPYENAQALISKNIATKIRWDD